METLTTVSAISFMGKRPHFVMWKLYGSECTWSASYPKDTLPFSLAKIKGHVDLGGSFQATDLDLEVADGLTHRKVKMIVIAPDVETATDQAMEDTVIIRGTKRTK